MKNKSAMIKVYSRVFLLFWSTSNMSFILAIDFKMAQNYKNSQLFIVAISMKNYRNA